MNINFVRKSGLLFLYFIFFFSTSITFAEEYPPPPIMPKQAFKQSLDLSPNKTTPEVKGRKLTVINDKNVIHTISMAMLKDGTFFPKGAAPDSFITIFEFQLNKKGENKAYFIRASAGPSGLCGAKTCPSLIYKRTGDSYTNIFESDMADKIIFIDKED